MLSEANRDLPGTAERRAMRRFDMCLPASVKFPDGKEYGDAAAGEVWTETQNVSARGVFFYLDRVVAQGTRLEVTTTFPPHVTLTDPLRVRFKARVVRVEAPLPVSRIGVAALIEEYEYLGSIPSPDDLDVQ
jgi:PilZ domain